MGRREDRMGANKPQEQKLQFKPGRVETRFANVCFAVKSIQGIIQARIVNPQIF